ncbi:MAG: hypothetical protein H6843_14035 [Rhodospirillaceae bacterium]|nr:hypothetical protein [Rhodospirillaceae bacterium]
MTGSVVYLFVDTNLLIQCRPLEQLDWSPWSNFEEVRLIVSNPVLREMDYRKNKGQDRLGSRARAASAMFRKMLPDGQKTIRESRPRVLLSIEPQHRYSRDLEDRLNYDERDDQLIGTIHEFARGNPGSDVRLLTHDTTPLYSARAHGLAAAVIPDDWLLPPEKSETEKELSALKAENARLKKAEPSFAVRCANTEGTEITRYEGSYTRYEPLTDDDVDGLMARLKECFPPETDFGPREPAERDAPPVGGLRVSGMKQIFTPATDEEIAEYLGESYPNWLTKCEEILRNHHWTLQKEETVLAFVFLAENNGTRPATDALITIEAQSQFEVRPPPSKRRDEQQSDDDDGPRMPELPRPPAVPHGRWRSSVGSQSTGLYTTMLQRSLRGMPGFAGFGSSVFDERVLQPPIIPPLHDPNAFYYSSGRSGVPQESFALECDQWRHEDGEEPFVGEICVPAGQQEAKGALICRIQASNLSRAVSLKIPVHIAIEHVRAFDDAEKMVEALTMRPSFRIKPSSGQSGTGGSA